MADPQQQQQQEVAQDAAMEEEEAETPFQAETAQLMSLNINIHSNKKIVFRKISSKCSDVSVPSIRKKKEMCVGSTASRSLA